MCDRHKALIGTIENNFGTLNLKYTVVLRTYICVRIGAIQGNLKKHVDARPMLNSNEEKENIMSQTARILHEELM